MREDETEEDRFAAVFKMVCSLPSRCACEGAGFDVVTDATGFSDAYAAVRKCRRCGRVYGTYVEG